MNEPELMQSLAERIARPAVRDKLTAIAGQLERELANDPAQPKSTFSAIPLSLYGQLPSEIRSSWLFHLRANLAHPAERHPNSIQRMFAFNRPGWFDWWDGSRWVSQLLEPGDTGLSIPVDTWHRMPAQAKPWTVASFHSAEADALIEVLGDPVSGGVTGERQYLAPD
jgi:hypothetical protein